MVLASGHGLISILFIFPELVLHRGFLAHDPLRALKAGNHSKTCWSSSCSWVWMVFFFNGIQWVSWIFRWVSNIYIYIFSEYLDRASLWRWTAKRRSRSADESTTRHRQLPSFCRCDWCLLRWCARSWKRISDQKLMPVFCSNSWVITFTSEKNVVF